MKRESFGSDKKRNTDAAKPHQQHDLVTTTKAPMLNVYFASRACQRIAFMGHA